jgi:hypothetical protein
MFVVDPAEKVQPLPNNIPGNGDVDGDCENNGDKDGDCENNVDKEGDGENDGDNQDGDGDLDGSVTELTSLHLLLVTS